MKTINFLSLLVSLAVLGVVFSPGVALSATKAGLTPGYLRCEYRVNPLGIGETQPRLSWIVEASGKGEAARGQRQTAYRVFVASSEAGLAEKTGDLWDSGKVASDETTCIVYAGKPLVSGLRCFWKVKVWDRHGVASEWSAPAMWTMGLLNAGDWKAEWIGFDKARLNTDLPDAPLEGAKWIWQASDKPLNAKAGHRLFVSTLALPVDIKIAKAELLAISDDNYKFVINSNLVSSGTAWQRAKATDVTQRLRGGDNSLRVEVWNATDGPAGLLAKLVVTAADGKKITHVTDASWKTAASPGANWHNRAIDASAWPAARVLGDYGMQPWGKAKLLSVTLPPVPFLRTGFRADKPVTRATLYATGLGIFDVHLNGQRVSDDWFNPGWTDYTKRVYYRAYDVTKLVRAGDNALGAVLADGWFSGYVGYGNNRDHYGKLPRVRAQLNIEFADGTTAVVGTGPNWKAATGPLLESDFLMGETYDARLALNGWDAPGFNDSKWELVVVGSSEVHRHLGSFVVGPKVEAHPGPPVVVFAELKAKRITEPKKGVYVLDMGQNFAGVARLKVKSAPGQKIVLRFAERLNPDGTIYTTNLRSARATDTYICRGDPKGESHVSRFTFHGFQYVEITGLKQKPAPDTVVGLALSSDTPVTGRFVCSDKILNQLHSNIYWTQRMNFMDIPTDCPQRDERLGWTGDAQVYVRTATLNTDVQAFFNKWLVDLCQDSQREDGQFPMVAPVKVAGPDGGPAWQEAGVICPWTIYEVYGDRRVLERNYAAMCRFVEFCRARSTPELLPPAKYHCFGDWLSINADTPKDIIYTAYFAYSAKLLSRTADVLGKTNDAGKYRDLFNQIKAAFNKAYVAEDGRIKGDTQTCYVLALVVGLLSDDGAAPHPNPLPADAGRGRASAAATRAGASSDKGAGGQTRAGASSIGGSGSLSPLPRRGGEGQGEGAVFATRLSAKEKLAAKYLVENIEARDGHLSTGFIGTKDLMLALAKIGRNDVAYRLIHNDTFPSWGFSIKHGATSIWERWNGWTPETGFGDPGMNSFAHYSFGAVYQWMVENIGGIRNDAHSSPHAPREVHSSGTSLHHAERDDYFGAGGVAYKKIVIAPTPGGKLTSADVRYDSIRGRIETAWKKSGDRLTLNVTIPANTTATVLFPQPFAAKGWANAITESGKPLAKAPGVKFLRMEADRAVLEVEAGSYRFSAR